MAWPIIIPLCAVRARRRGRPLLASMLGFLTVVTFIAYARFAYFNLPLGDKRIAELRLENGMEFAVHQTCNYSIEPYTTRFYNRISAADPWHAFYMDHEDSRWWSGRIDFDDQKQEVVVRKGKQTMALFNIRTREFIRGVHASTNAMIVLAQGEEPGDELNKSR